MFSVVIPLYNKEKYISKAIHSVLNQTFTDWELVIVNDGSTDTSLETMKKILDDFRTKNNYFPQNQAIQIINQPNQGVSAARNNGAKIAKFQYLAFLDADDWWQENFLYEMAATITLFPEAAIYGCRFWICRNGSNKLVDVPLGDNFCRGYINYFKTYSTTFSTPFNCSFVVVGKGEFESAGGFNTNLKFGEDFELWVRMALKYKIAYINMPLATSNQDVEINNRALGEMKIYHPKNHFIFNLNIFINHEIENKDLKNLLDGLRLRALLSYYVSGAYKPEVKQVLQCVNWQGQTLYYRGLYHLPIIVVKLFFWTRRFASRINCFMKIIIK